MTTDSVLETAKSTFTQSKWEDFPTDDYKFVLSREHKHQKSWTAVGRELTPDFRIQASTEWKLLFAEYH